MGSLRYIHRHSAAGLWLNVVEVYVCSLEMQVRAVVLLLYALV